VTKIGTTMGTQILELCEFVVNDLESYYRVGIYSLWSLHQFVAES